MPSHYFRFTRLEGMGGHRSPLLERLLARAHSPTLVLDWRSDAFRIIAPRSAGVPGVAAAALCAEPGPADAASVFIATPVQYFAEMSNVRLPADGILDLQRSEAELLAVDFNRVWHDAGIRLRAGRRALFCLFDQWIEAATDDPEKVRGRRIHDHLPSGADGARLRRLMSEIEMWLFDHAANRIRSALPAPALAGLWLWGGGAPMSRLPAVDGWTAGDDPLFKAFDPDQVRAGQSLAGPGVLVTAAEPGTEAWRDMESRWLGRSLAELSAGRISRLELSAGNRCFSISSRWNWRPWRRLRPWWEFFHEAD